MIESFVSTWDLFANSYLAGWGMAVLLSLVGVLVVVRDQIFVGAAVSQASTLGVACALWLGGGFGASAPAWLGSDAFAAALAVLFSIAAALLVGRNGGESAEARTGWLFLLASSLSVLILAHSPHGLEEIHRLVASSLIGASRTDVWLFGALALGTALAVVVASRRMLLVTTDPTMAEALGMRAGAWSAAIAVAMGLAVGLAIRSSGMLYTFGCLVLPALVAKNVCRELREMFVVSPAVGLAASVVGFVLANFYDYPPAQLTVALLAGLLVLAWGARSLRVSRAMG
jgi:ABC-type Mn2+/Zn2+ transport system permease subunit